jgi:hypothetical protein
MSFAYLSLLKKKVKKIEWNWMKKVKTCQFDLTKLFWPCIF